MSERKKGSTSVSLLFRLTDSTTGAAKSGIDVTTLKLQYERPGAAASTATSLTLLATTATAFTAFGAIEIDSTNSKGVYRVDCPDAGFATGADEVAFTVTGTGIEPSTRLIDLTSFDSRDGVRGGLTSLPNVASGSAGALPTTGTGANQIHVDGSGNTYSVDQFGNQLAGWVQVSNIAVPGAALNAVAVSETLTTGTDSGGLAGTGILAGDFDTWTAVGGAIDGYYQFNLSATQGAVGVSVAWNGYFAGTATAAIGVSAFNWGSSTWERIGSISATTNATGYTEVFELTTAHTGTGANAGLVRIRFNTGSAATSLNTDRILLGYAVVPTPPANWSSLGIGANGHILNVDTTTNLTNAPTAGDFTATMKTSLNAATPQVTLAANQHVIVDSGTVTTVTGGATAAGQTSILNAVGAITTNTARTGITVPQFVPLPASGTSVVRVKIKLFNLQGALEDADTNTVTVHASNAAGTSLDANLSATTATRDNAGQYHVDYTVHAADAEGGVYIAVTYTVGAVNMAGSAAFAVAQADTVTSIASILSGVNTINANVGTNGAGLTAIGDTRLAHLDANVSSRAAQGDQMDLINAPNTTALAAIAATFWRDVTAADFSVAGSPGHILVTQLGGTFTTANSSVFTIAALANGPSGSGGGGDPWATFLPGTYMEGQAGFIVGTFIPGCFQASSYQASPLQSSFVNSSLPGNTPFTKTFTQGDLRTNIADILVDATGSPINLTGSTIAFRMISQTDKSVKVNNAAANLDDAPNGKVSYSWQAADLDAPGLYYGWWIVTTGGKTEHFPGDGEKMTVKVVVSE